MLSQPFGLHGNGRATWMEKRTAGPAFALRATAGRRDRPWHIKHARRPRRAAARDSLTQQHAAAQEGRRAGMMRAAARDVTSGTAVRDARSRKPPAGAGPASASGWGGALRAKKEARTGRTSQDGRPSTLVPSERWNQPVCQRGASGRLWPSRRSGRDRHNPIRLPTGLSSVVPMCSGIRTRQEADRFASTSMLRFFHRRAKGKNFTETDLRPVCAPR